MDADVGAPGSVVPEDPVPEGAVVAAIDGESHDPLVVAWAVEEAHRRGTPLHVQEVVDVGISLMAGEGYLPMTSLPPDTVEGDRTALAAAADLAHRRRPEVEVTCSSASGSVAGVLVAIGESASTLVLGGGGTPGTPFIGSTALSVAAHAKCPTIVLPNSSVGTDNRVVVGVDGSRSSYTAAEYALAYAERHGASVRCLVSWSVEVVDGCVVTTPGTPEWEAVEERHLALVERLLADLRPRHPEVEIDIVVRRGRASSLLVEEAEGAALLAVGTRGRGGFTGMLLGSTTKRVLKIASCPVAVLHH